MNTQDVLTHHDRAVALFMEGYNCAQATAGAFADDFGISRESILRMTAGFGGGIGGLREKCGAVSGMVFVTGLYAGDYNPEDAEAKKRLYDLVKEVNAEFTERFGTTCCRELLEKAECPAPPDPSERNAQYYASRPCARLVGAAAEIISKKIIR